jgi:hypothetical protein
VATVIDVEFVELPPPQLEEIMAESERAHCEAMTRIAIISAAPVLLTAALWLIAANFG